MLQRPYITLCAGRHPFVAWPGDLSLGGYNSYTTSMHIEEGKGDKGDRSSDDAPRAPEEVFELLAPFLASGDFSVPLVDGHRFSQQSIARTVSARLEKLGMTMHTLHEETGVPLDTLRKIVDGTYDLKDFEPILAIEPVLKVSLRDL
ncbi:hypothetical protein OAO01_05430 [Oligoflexia bacterium]|nr:hypothetical protein [Oligoflexia bacterium]